MDGDITADQSEDIARRIAEALGPGSLGPGSLGPGSLGPGSTAAMRPASNTLLDERISGDTTSKAMLLPATDHAQQTLEVDELPTVSATDAQRYPPKHRSRAMSEQDIPTAARPTAALAEQDDETLRESEQDEPTTRQPRNPAQSSDQRGLSNDLLEAAVLRAKAITRLEREGHARPAIDSELQTLTAQTRPNASDAWLGTGALFDDSTDEEVETAVMHQQVPDPPLTPQSRRRSERSHGIERRLIRPAKGVSADPADQTRVDSPSARLAAIAHPDASPSGTDLPRPDFPSSHLSLPRNGPLERDALEHNTVEPNRELQKLLIDMRRRRRNNVFGIIALAALAGTVALLIWYIRAF